MTVAAGLMLTSSGCKTTEEKQQARADSAAAAIGRMLVAPQKPKLPPECLSAMGRTYPRLGEKFRATQLRWEYLADVEDALKRRCATFYDAS